ncbi:MAG TPA: phosphate ABC transporter permease PstA [Actinomycetota bacterium]
MEVAAAALAAGCSVRALFLVMDWHGSLAAVVWSYAAFFAFYRVLASASGGRVVATDRLMTLAIATGALLALGALGWLVGFVVLRGLPALRPAFFTQDLSRAGPLNPGGGALHGIIGTLEQVGLATVVAAPVAVLTAVYLNEVGGRLAAVIRFFVDALGGLPSIVAGLLVYTVWIVAERGGFSGAAGSAALVVLMLPTITRTSEEVLRTVPDELREAGLALGAPQWRNVARVVLPAARTGLVTASVLGVARVVGETAPMILTAFGASAVNRNPFHAPQADLPLFVWSLLRQPNSRQIDRAWTGALVLVLLILVLFALARVVSSGGRPRRWARMRR